MAFEPSPPTCRSCRAALSHPILDLGAQPVADLLVEPGQPGPDPVYPLQVSVCDSCGLVQLPSRDTPPPTAAHGHGAAFSSTVVAHLASWASELVERFQIGPQQLVADVAIGDGSLLGQFISTGARLAGLTDATGDPDHAGSDLPAINARLGRDGASRLLAQHGPADLILVNHALAHADDLDDAIAGLSLLLADGGSIAIETHHVLGLLHGQFDIVSHAHRSYLSLAALERALVRHDLVVHQAVKFDLHGGTLRLVAGRGAPRAARSGVAAPEMEAVRAIERASKLDMVSAYERLGPAAERALSDLRAFMGRCHRAGDLVAGYGAPTRGTTLLNAAGVTSADLAFTVDRSPAKQGKLLPGSRIPIRSTDAVPAARPDFLVVLPWPLFEEIRSQMAVISTWGGRFVVPLPSLSVRDGVTA